MASGRLQRAQAKAQRRKKLLAERRKAAGGERSYGLAAEIRRAAAAPIRDCLLHDEILERGNGTLILTRRTGAHQVACAAFMLDTFCVGVKDTAFHLADETEIELIIDEFGQAAPFTPVDPAYARKLLHDLVAYARSLGLEPAADYTVLERMFGDVAAESCETSFEFGKAGRPVYIPGPLDSPTQMRRRIEKLRRTLGDDGFDIIAAAGMDDPLDFEESEWEDEYDPEIEPDPAAWLALDETERQLQVEAYHRHAGIEAERPQVHAAVHVIVENQSAMGDELPVRRAIDRLMGEGLTRHEAVHAVASVLADYINRLLRDKPAAADHQAACNAAVEQLTAESWRRDYGSEED
jgi:hypothetical protein